MSSFQEQRPPLAWRPDHEAELSYLRRETTHQRNQHNRWYNKAKQYAALIQKLEDELKELR